MAITEKTADRLLALASEAQAIGDALYEHCLTDGATLAIHGAQELAAASNWVRSHVLLTPKGGEA